MADDLTQRMMDNEADANRDIGEKSFEHTIESRPLDPSERLNSLLSPQTVTASGAELRQSLLERAEEAAYLQSTLGNDSQFLDYKRSSVGARGQDKEVRRELTLRSRDERKRREERFSKQARDRQKHERRPLSSKHTSDRQRYNASGALDGKNDTPTTNRQDFNARPDSDSPRDRIVFREPPARGYNPFQ